MQGSPCLLSCSPLYRYGNPSGPRHLVTIVTVAHQTSVWMNVDALRTSHFPGRFIRLADANKSSFALWTELSMPIFVVCFAVQMLASMMRIESFEV